ncbi:hypothetical protein DFJ43DRAFT_679443 [Lentinula guzmanii]|uniref:Uncharacterized protein n=1 Tax=Lentinula guzmanii TaxID=2804957 RepID=A0AA38JGG3_9AGAR|nr:hypothetical protein DFJ43DRAFT_679443 [Lentinula guzmanii]
MLFWSQLRFTCEASIRYFWSKIVHVSLTKLCDMAPIIHYATFPVSHVGIERFPSLKGAFGQLNKAEGHINSFHGLQVAEEGPKNIYFISIWESSLLHRKFKEISMAVSVAGDQFFHREFDVLKGTAIPGLESKTTEFVIITPKEGASYDKVREAGLKVRDVLDSNGHPAVFAESVQGDGMFLMIVGWLSSTHHLNTVKEEPYISLAKEFREVGNTSFSHANLTKNHDE